MIEKAKLLDEVQPVLTPPKNIDFRYLVYMILILSFIFLSIFPKIYIQQQIYFKSREIAKLQTEYNILKEENNLISASIESIKFKNQILDTLF